MASGGGRLAVVVGSAPAGRHGVVEARQADGWIAWGVDDVDTAHDLARLLPAGAFDVAVAIGGKTPRGGLELVARTVVIDSPSGRARNDEEHATPGDVRESVAENGASLVWDGVGDYVLDLERAVLVTPKGDAPIPPRMVALFALVFLAADAGEPAPKALVVADRIGFTNPDALRKGLERYRTKLRVFDVGKDDIVDAQDRVYRRASGWERRVAPPPVAPGQQRPNEATPSLGGWIAELDTWSSDVLAGLRTCARAVQDRLEKRGSLVAVVGAPFAAKSNVARMVARDALANDWHVWLVDAAGVRDLDELLAATRGGLGSRGLSALIDDEGELVPIEGDIVVVFDQACEGWHAVGDLRTRWRASDRGVRILVTSRVPVRLPAVWTVRHDGLPPGAMTTHVEQRLDAVDVDCRENGWIRELDGNPRLVDDVVRAHEHPECRELTDSTAKAALGAGMLDAVRSAARAWPPQVRRSAIALARHDQFLVPEDLLDRLAAFTGDEPRMDALDELHDVGALVAAPEGPADGLRLLGVYRMVLRHDDQGPSADERAAWVARRFATGAGRGGSTLPDSELSAAFDHLVEAGDVANAEQILVECVRRRRRAQDGPGAVALIRRFLATSGGTLSTVHPVLIDELLAQGEDELIVGLHGAGRREDRRPSGLAHRATAHLARRGARLDDAVRALADGAAEYDGTGRRADAALVHAEAAVIHVRRRALPDAQVAVARAAHRLPCVPSVTGEEARVRMAEALLDLGWPEDALVVLDMVAERATELGAPRLAAIARLVEVLAQLDLAGDDIQPADLERASRVLREVDEELLPAVERSRALRARALVELLHGDPGGALHRAMGALEAARTAADPEAQALGTAIEAVLRHLSAQDAEAAFASLSGRRTRWRAPIAVVLGDLVRTLRNTRDVARELRSRGQGQPISEAEASDFQRQVVALAALGGGKTAVLAETRVLIRAAVVQLGRELTR